MVFLYNPDRKERGQLIDEFVVRTGVYEEIMRDLGTADTRYPGQQYLIIGPRGAGKTTLLNRLKYGIEDTEKISDKFIPVIFNEEQYHISELSDLWESIAAFLEDYHDFKGIITEMASQFGKKDQEGQSFAILEKYLNSFKKEIILLMDNFGDFLKKIGEQEVRRLRTVLQTKKHIRLIAASPFYLDTMLDYHSPLFEFFKVIRLNGLSATETLTLLRVLAKMHQKEFEIERIIKEAPQRIEILRSLTDGVPRTIVLMFRILTDYNDQDSIADMEKILDAVTPLYKHRMDDLPKQQQRIIDAMAKNWDAISVKDLKDRVRLDGKNVSSQLRQLEKNFVVEKRMTDTKNHLYLVKERFFNIWYLMRYGRKDDKERVIWLVRFLESWCSSIDLKERIVHFVNQIKEGKFYETVIQIFGHTYASLVDKDISLKLLLKRSTPQNISNFINISNTEILNEMKKCEKNKDWERLFELGYNIKNPDTEVKLYISNLFFHILDHQDTVDVLTRFRSKFEYATNNLKTYSGLLQFDYVIMESVMVQYITMKIFREPEEVFELFLNFCRLLSMAGFGGHQSADLFEITAMTEMLSTMLAKRYYNIVYKIFIEITELDLKTILKPLYFAMIFLKDGNKSQEFLKAGPEISESIELLLEKIGEKDSLSDNFKG